MNHDPLSRSHSAPGRSSRKAGRLAPACCLILALVWTVAGARIAWPAAKPPPASPAGLPQGDRPMLPDEPTVLSLWGTVRTVPDAKRVVVVTPDNARYDIRLLGVEPPEPPRPAGSRTPATQGQPFGLEAAAYLRDLVADKQVRLEAYGKDGSGRMLAVVWLGDINVNLTLVKEGLAWVSPNVSVLKVRVELEVAERQARVGKYGLWALPKPESPWDFRKRYRLPAE
jgi:endonuclease YncB( thermonuclease family)